MVIKKSSNTFIGIAAGLVFIVLVVIIFLQVTASQGSGITAAVAVLHPTEDSQVEGTVRFEQLHDVVRVTADLSGLPPNSVHGFHIHEYGDCTASDASSAGGHYSPSYNKHGDPEGPFHHAGDLGNVRSDADGRVHMVKSYGSITVDGDDNPVIGRAVIVHEKADDFVSQPSGAAGRRLACGVIGVANPETAADAAEED